MYVRTCIARPDVPISDTSTVYPGATPCKHYISSSTAIFCYAFTGRRALRFKTRRTEDPDQSLVRVLSPIHTGTAARRHDRISSTSFRHNIIMPCNDIVIMCVRTDTSEHGPLHTVSTIFRHVLSRCVGLVCVLYFCFYFRFN